VVGVGVLHAVVQVTPVAVGGRRIPAQGEGVRSGVRGQSDVGGTGGTFCTSDVRAFPALWTGTLLCETSSVPEVASQTLALGHTLFVFGVVRTGDACVHWITG
jgi:hypothetical protein